MLAYCMSNAEVVLEEEREPGDPCVPPLRNANLAALYIDLIEANRHQLAHANPSIEQRFDQDHIREVSAVPHGLVKNVL